ncbi:uncharacterized protein LOC143625403 isoform X1 [Bidens hawaiensis]|uniref:uncharacterized protein LOC143625403 isoform X1 n=1 Tax=Bidens hawaiensis TaxID=980011 RepID=UPI00404B1BCB
MYEPILEEAYHNSGKVILIFSVNMSGYFQGYAQMISSVGWRRDNVWSHGYGGGKPWGRSFKVKWLRLQDLPFQKTLHLKNPLNDYKPVKISRDCQELPQDIGEALCELIDGESGVDENQTFCGLQDTGPMHLGPLLYPSLYYQHTSHQNPFINRSVADVDTGSDGSVLYDGWDMSAERSLHANTLTDDDILEMSTLKLMAEATGFHINRGTSLLEKAEIHLLAKRMMMTLIHGLARRRGVVITMVIVMMMVIIIVRPRNDIQIG